MALKTELVIRLFAGDVMVAEVADERLWQRTLAAITGTTASKEESQPEPHAENGTAAEGRTAQRTGSVEQFAEVVGVPITTLQAACSPSDSAPFIHLDHRHWEAFKKNFPAGPGSVGPAAATATLLALWAKHRNAAPPSVREAQAVLQTVNTRDQNVGRSIKNCSWLQRRGETISINPAEFSRATTFVRAFCMKSRQTEKHES